MKRNSRLFLALHTLSHMAGDPDQVRTSSAIAAHAGTNPVVVRRVLGKLRQAGMLSSEKGHSGGWRLAKEPDQITLGDVYVALGEQLVAGNDKESEEVDCSVEHAVHRRVVDVLSLAEKNLVKSLSHTRISDVPA